MKLKRIHRVIEFNQEPWLKLHIDFNIENRKQSKNQLESNFFKTSNNSVYDKTIENYRKRVNI